jgi:hypothetical protein
MPDSVADSLAINDAPTPGDWGFAAWTFPIYTAHTVGKILTTAGSVFGSGLYVRRPVTVTNLVAMVTVAGGTLTAGDCWGMLYSSAGTLIAQTADQATPWATAGLSTMALTAKTGQSLTLQPGLYWGAVVATGTTLPTFAVAGSAAATVSIAADAAFYNATTGAAVSRCGVLATSITTTPAAITPSSITQATGLPIWFGLV